MPSRDRDKDNDFERLVREQEFPLGRLMMTPGVQASVPQSELLRALRRHASKDWGDVCADDARANDDALKQGSRLLSSYKTTGGVKFWILTEANRASTTALLPDEY